MPGCSPDDRTTRRRARPEAENGHRRRTHEHGGGQRAQGNRLFQDQGAGLEAHSSASHRGVNAVQHAARLVAFLTDMAEEMEAGANPESGFDPPYTTIHVGTIGGGTAQNIVPLDCSFTWEYRLMPGAESDEIRQRFDRFANETVLPRMHAVDPNTGIVTEHLCTVPGLEPDVGSPAESAAMALARRNRTEVVAYATEGGQFQQAGIPTVVCGPGSNRTGPPAERVHRTEPGAGMRSLSAPAVGRSLCGPRDSNRPRRFRRETRLNDSRPPTPQSPGTCTSRACLLVARGPLLSVRGRPAQGRPGKPCQGNVAKTGIFRAMLSRRAVFQKRNEFGCNSSQRSESTWTILPAHPQPPAQAIIGYRLR